MNESSQSPPSDDSACAAPDESMGTTSDDSRGTASDASANPTVFKPIAKLAKAVQVLVIIQLSFAGAILLLFFGSILAEVLELQNLSDLATNTIDVIGIVQLILYCVTGFLFIRMLLRAFRNLPALNVTETFNKEWHVKWSWFIPLVSLWIPYSVVREVWKASDPAVLDGSAWKQTKGSKLVRAWWILYLIYGFLGGACKLLDKTLTKDPQNEVLALLLLPAFIGRECVLIAAGVLFILVVRAIVSRQEKKRELLKTQGE